MTFGGFQEPCQMALYLKNVVSICKRDEPSSSSPPHGSVVAFVMLSYAQLTSVCLFYPVFEVLEGKVHVLFFGSP